MLHLAIICIACAVSALNEGITFIERKNNEFGPFCLSNEEKQNITKVSVPRDYNVDAHNSSDCDRQKISKRTCSFFYDYIINQYKSSRNSSSLSRLKNSNLNVDFAFRKRNLLWENSESPSLKDRRNLAKAMCKKKGDKCKLKKKKGKEKLTKNSDSLNHEEKKLFLKLKAFRDMNSTRALHRQMHDLDIEKRVEKFCKKLEMENELRKENDAMKKKGKSEQREKAPFESSENSVSLFDKLSNIFSFRKNSFRDKNSNADNIGPLLSVNTEWPKVPLAQKTASAGTYNIPGEFPVSKIRGNGHDYSENLKPNHRKYLYAKPYPYSANFKSKINSFNPYQKFVFGKKRKRHYVIRSVPYRPHQELENWPFYKKLSHHHSRINGMRPKRYEELILKKKSLMSNIREFEIPQNGKKSSKSYTDLGRIKKNKVLKRREDIFKEMKNAVKEDSAVLNQRQKYERDALPDHTIEKPFLKEDSINQMEKYDFSEVGPPRRGGVAPIFPGIKVHPKLKRCLRRNAVKIRRSCVMKSGCGSKKCWRSAPLLCIPYIRKGQEEILKYIIRILQQMLGKPLPPKKDIFGRTKFKPTKDNTGTGGCDDSCEDECDAETVTPTVMSNTCSTAKPCGRVTKIRTCKATTSTATQAMVATAVSTTAPTTGSTSASTSGPAMASTSASTSGSVIMSTVLSAMGPVNTPVTLTSNGATICPPIMTPCSIMIPPMQRRINLVSSQAYTSTQPSIFTQTFKCLPPANCDSLSHLMITSSLGNKWLTNPPLLVSSEAPTLNPFPNSVSLRPTLMPSASSAVTPYGSSALLAPSNEILFSGYANPDFQNNIKAPVAVNISATESLIPAVTELSTMATTAEPSYISSTASYTTYFSNTPFKQEDFPSLTSNSYTPITEFSTTQTNEFTDLNTPKTTYEDLKVPNFIERESQIIDYDRNYDNFGNFSFNIKDIQQRPSATVPSSSINDILQYPFDFDAFKKIEKPHKYESKKRINNRKGFNSNDYFFDDNHQPDQDLNFFFKKKKLSKINNQKKHLKQNLLSSVTVPSLPIDYYLYDDYPKLDKNNKIGLKKHSKKPSKYHNRRGKNRKVKHFENEIPLPRRKREDDYIWPEIYSDYEDEFNYGEGGLIKLQDDSSKTWGKNSSELVNWTPPFYDMFNEMAKAMTGVLTTESQEGKTTVSLNSSTAFPSLKANNRTTTTALNSTLASNSTIPTNATTSTNHTARNSYGNINQTIIAYSLGNINKTTVDNSTSNINKTTVDNSTSNINKTTVDNSTSNINKTITANNKSNLNKTTLDNSTSNINKTLVANSPSNSYKAMVGNRPVNIYKTLVANSPSNIYKSTVDNSTSNINKTTVDNSTSNSIKTMVANSTSPKRNATDGDGSFITKVYETYGRDNFTAVPSSSGSVTKTTALNTTRGVTVSTAETSDKSTHNDTSHLNGGGTNVTSPGSSATSTKVLNTTASPLSSIIKSEVSKPKNFTGTAVSRTMIHRSGKLHRNAKFYSKIRSDNLLVSTTERKNIPSLASSNQSSNSSRPLRIDVISTKLGGKLLGSKNLNNLKSGKSFFQANSKTNSSDAEPPTDKNSKKDEKENQDSDGGEGQVATTLKMAVIVKGPKKLITKPSPKVYSKVYPDSFDSGVGSNETTSVSTMTTTKTFLENKTALLSSTLKPDIRLQLLAVCEGYLEIIKRIKASNQTFGENLDAELAQYCESIISQSFNTQLEKPKKTESVESPPKNSSSASLDEKNENNFKYTNKGNQLSALQEVYESDKKFSDLQKTTDDMADNAVSEKRNETREIKKKTENSTEDKDLSEMDSIEGGNCTVKIKIKKRPKDLSKTTLSQKDGENDRAEEGISKRGISEEQVNLIKLLKKRKRALMSWLMNPRDQYKMDEMPEVEYFDDEDFSPPDSDFSEYSGTIKPRRSDKYPKKTPQYSFFMNKTLFPVYAKHYGYDRDGELREVEVLWRKINEKTHEEKILKNMSVLAFLMAPTDDPSLYRKDEKIQGNNGLEGEDLSESDLNIGKKVGFASKVAVNQDKISSSETEKPDTSTETNQTSSNSTSNKPKAIKLARKNETHTFISKPALSSIVGTPPSKNKTHLNITRKASHKFGVAKDIFQEYSIEFLNYAVYILPAMFTILFFFCCFGCALYILKTRKSFRNGKKKKKRSFSSDETSETSDDSEDSRKKRKRESKLEKKVKKKFWNVLKMPQSSGKDMQEENSQSERKNFLKFLKYKKDENKDEGKTFSKKYPDSADESDQLAVKEEKPKNDANSEAVERRELISLLEELKKIELEHTGEKKEVKSVQVQYAIEHDDNPFRRPEFSYPFEKNIFGLPKGYFFCDKKFPYQKTNSPVVKDFELYGDVSEMTELLPCECGYYAKKKDCFRHCDFRLNQEGRNKCIYKIYQDSGVNQNKHFGEKFLASDSETQNFVINNYKNVNSDSSEDFMGVNKKNLGRDVRIDENQSPFRLLFKKNTGLMDEMENMKHHLGKKKYVRLKDDGVLCRL